MGFELKMYNVFDNCLLVALGHAINIIMQQEDNYQKHYTFLIQTLLYSLIQYLGQDNSKISNNRLSNTLSIGIKNINSAVLLKNISSKVAASSGSACHSNNDVSKVLQVMNVPLEYALGTVRLSVGFNSTVNDVRDAAKIISSEVHHLWNQ